MDNIDSKSDPNYSHVEVDSISPRVPRLKQTPQISVTVDDDLQFPPISARTDEEIRNNHIDSARTHDGVH